MKKFSALCAAAFLSFFASAFAEQLPDSMILTGPAFQQVPSSKIVVTPSGGTQTTLGTALGLACPKTGCTFTGPLHMGSNLLDGSNIAFTGGTLNGVSIGATTPGTGAFTTLGATGAATFNSGITTVGASIANFGTTTGGAVAITPGTGASPGILSFGGGGGNISAGSGKNITIVGGAGFVFNNGMSTNYAYNLSASAMNPIVSFGISPGSGSTTTTNPSLVSLADPNGDSLAVGLSNVNFMSIDYAFGGAAMTGQRTGLFVKTTQTATTGNKGIGWGAGGLYTPVAFAHQQNFGEGGTDLSQAGSFGAIFGGTNVIRTISTATNLHEVTAWEADMNTAAPSYKKFGWKVTQLPTDTAQGILDGAFVIENGGTATSNGWHNGFLAIEPNAGFPYDVTGCILCAPLSSDYLTVANTMAYGVDFEQTLFTGYAFRSRGFGVDGAGTAHVGNAYIKANATGAALDMLGSLGPAEGTTISGAAIVSGGTGGRLAGAVMYGPNGGEYKISAASAGVVTQLIVLRQPSFNSATPPSNPVTLTDWLSAYGNTTGTVQINLTWTQPNLLSLNPSGNTVVGTGSALATTAASGFLQIATMAGAPTGTVGAAGQAAVVIDTTNKKLCFSTGGGTWECSAAFTP